MQEGGFEVKTVTAASRAGDVLGVFGDGGRGRVVSSFDSFSLPGPFLTHCNPLGRLGNHHVAVEESVGDVLAEGLYHRGTPSYVRDEITVHYVEVELGGKEQSEGEKRSDGQEVVLQ